MDVDAALENALQPLIRIMAAKVTVARVEINAEGRAFHQGINPIQSFWAPAVLLVRLQPRKMPRGSGRLHGLVNGCSA